MIDSHCHLDYPSFDKDRKAVVEQAKKTGVKLIINPAADFASNEKVFKVSEKFPGYVLPCAGIDPVSCLQERDKIAELDKYFDKCVAIGEVGLDYYWSKEKEQEIENFKRFIDLALDYGKPLVVHARNAMKDVLEVLEKKRVERAVLHCFSGDKLDAKKAGDLGFYMSFATNICYNDSKSLIKDVSLSYILAETDSPYLHPFRQGRNEPKNVRFALEEIASVKELALEEVEKITEKNTKKAFGL